MTIEKETKEKNHSIMTLISYSAISFGCGTVFQFINAYLLYFYEVEIGLSILLYTVSSIIYSISASINDPIMGYLSDKPRFYTKRWGRRFPWILFGSIPISIFTLLLFSPPNVDPVENAIFIFIWLTLIHCSLEWFYTAYITNHSALYPQKFRSNRDRRYITGFSLVSYSAMLFFGIVVPPLIIIYGDKSSFFMAGLIIALISIPFIIIGIPGCREDKDLIEDFLNSEKLHKKKGDFIHTLKELLKNRNFIAMIIMWMCFNTFSGLTLGSIIYYTRYILQVEAIWGSIIMLGFLIGGLITIPFWMWILGKIGEIKLLCIGGLGMAVSMLPILLFRNVFAAILASLLAGITLCALNMSDQQLFASVIDEVVGRERRRKEGVYSGIQTLITGITGPLTTIIFATTHIVTSFDPAADVQTPLAQWGILADVALIPMILAVIGVLLFWRIWALTEKERLDLRVKMRELNL